MNGNQSLTMGDRGRIVVPIEIRERRGLEPGTPLVFVDSDEGLVIMTRAQALSAVRRQLVGHPSLVDSLLADRRAAVAAGN